MTPENFFPSGRNEVIVRIYSYEGRCPKGTLSGPRFDVPVAFHSLVQLLMTMEEQMDRVNDPQRGEEPRTFQHLESPPRTSERAAGGEKPLATFRISVLFRQNASWQGTLLWTERALDAQFRSVLELIRLIDSALISNPG